MTYDHFIIAIAMIAMGRVPLGLHSDPFHEAMRLIEQQVCVSRCALEHLLFSLTHTTIACTCCCDETKGNQDLNICSHADSLILSLAVYLWPESIDSLTHSDRLQLTA